MFKLKPPERITIWQFWQRLQDRAIAFFPGKSATGVFPMIFLPGLSGQFISIAETDEAAQALKPQVELCFEVGWCRVYEQHSRIVQTVAWLVFVLGFNWGADAQTLLLHCAGH